MDIKFLRRFGLTISLLTAATIAHSEQIACPSLNTIQQHATKIDAVETDIFGYSVHSTNYFTDGDLQWIVGVNRVMAPSPEEALLKGIIIVINSKYVDDEYAYELEKGLFICNYGPADIVVAGGNPASALRFVAHNN
ncbi:hypothetical protein [Legionella sp. CNM-4043-24]|uniref:hypothetical protein n=1 Tax=Legionella sp. CNM-4043-24 TaxID=3421646 RepID=UPI00403AA9A2